MEERLRRDRTVSALVPLTPFFSNSLLHTQPREDSPAWNRDRSGPRSPVFYFLYSTNTLIYTYVLYIFIINISEGPTHDSTILRRNVMPKGGKREQKRRRVKKERKKERKKRDRERRGDETLCTISLKCAYVRDCMCAREDECRSDENERTGARTSNNT